MERKGKALVPKRTEYGKRIRGVYERGEIKEKIGNMRQYEPRADGICNTITTVSKDYMYLGKVVGMSEEKMIEPEEEKTLEDYLYTAKDGEQYGIFKLSPRECGRLMGVTDADITKMLSVNSRSQCYKQFGNSIVVPVLMAIFSQLNIAGVKAWNDMTEYERKELVRNTTRDWEV